MAGDYMKDFATANANNKKDEQKDFTYQGSNGKNYGTNTEKMLFGNSPTSSDSPTSSKKEVSSQPVGNPIDYEGGYSNWTSEDWIKAYETNNDVADTWNKEQITTYADGRQEMSGTTARKNIQKTYQHKMDQAKWLESYQGPTTWDEAFAPDLPTSQYKGNLASINKYNAAVNAKNSLAKQYEEWSKKNK